ncbi:membrane protein insertase YidC [Elusimicrobiota bacterium]
MDRNTFLAVFLSAVFLIVWWTFFQPKQAKKPVETAKVSQQVHAEQKIAAKTTVEKKQKSSSYKHSIVAEREVTVETEKYKVVFTNRGAAVKKWFIKEKSGTLTNLVLSEDTYPLTNFPGSNYRVSKPSPNKVVFSHVSSQGWEIVKTYDLSDSYLHDLSIEVRKTKAISSFPELNLGWGPGLGTDTKELKENTSLTRVIGCSLAEPTKLEKFKETRQPASAYKWYGIGNRYFLAAFVPEDNTQFKDLEVYRDSKKHPYGMLLTAKLNPEIRKHTIKAKLYVGPKEYFGLKSLNLGLKQAVDFGFFGFLGKIVLYALNYLYNITHNFGWAIILLTIGMQIIVAPLTIKSFKATAAMKHLQPKMKALQDQYKGDPKRLNAEMLNLYKTQKVNPLGGCLPMLLQLPIFWALFTTLRGAYELRGAPWILWVKDLSAPDALFMVGNIGFNVLPLIMGAGMFLQQRLMSVSSDPTQQKMMYLMPVIFTFMFWGFPSGLVLYWLTNSILTMTEQYFILKRSSSPR